VPKELPDTTDRAAALGEVKFRAEVEAYAAACIAAESGKFKTAYDLLKKHGRRKRPSIINGIARQRDIVNIVAASKMGKTWFCHNLAIAVAAGLPFLIDDWKTEQGKVVIFDNELHEDSIADRLPFICEKANLDIDPLKEIIVINCRGKGYNIDNIAPLMTELKVFNPKLIIFDSLYRFYPKGTNEMDPSAITDMYNTLDRYAAIIQTAAFAMVIHSTKGSQGDKEVMEVGSGTGGFGRATDNHIVVREDEADGKYVLETKARDWAEQKPLVIKKEFPLFIADLEATPNIKGKKTSTKAVQRETKNDDKDFIAALTPCLQHHKAIEKALSLSLKIPKSDAQVLVNGIVGRFGITDLNNNEDRICGAFMAKKINGAMWFKIKG
jgi:RecA-family ATPase